jgi:Zn ribbon nucleic-acid-binding protein
MPKPKKDMLIRLESIEKRLDPVLVTYVNTLKYQSKRDILLFLGKAIDKHGQTFSYTGLIYKNWSTYIDITCTLHGKVKVLPATHIRRTCGGCEPCDLLQKLQSFLKKANEEHDYRYDYSKVIYINSSTPIIIICPDHGNFIKRPDNHAEGARCPKCVAIERVSVKTTEQFVSQVSSIHKNKYLYLKTDYKHNYIEVIITCEKHGDYKKKPVQHIRGQGCPECENEYNERLIAEKTVDFLERIKDVHTEGEYDYSKVKLVASDQKITIIHNKCRKEFDQYPHDHLRGSGCNQCKFKSENACRLICETLTGYKFPKIRPAFLKNPQTGRNLELDCYCENLNLAFEYNDHVIQFGFQTDDHFARQKELDELKKELCAENQTTLIYVPLKYNIQNLPMMEKFIKEKLIENGFEKYILDAKGDKKINPITSNATSPITKIKLKLKSIAIPLQQYHQKI